MRNAAGSSLSICIVVVARVSDMRPLLSSKGKRAAALQYDEDMHYHINIKNDMIYKTRPCCDWQR